MTGIMTELHSKEVKMLHEVACGFNSDGVPCPYDGGFWTARRIVQAIAERTHQHLARRSAAS